MAREGKSKGRIITPKASREITILFYQNLNGAWTTYSEYPKSEFETLYACYRAQHFKHKQPNEEVKKEFVELVKRCYSDWMFHIKNPIFNKYTEKKDRYRMVLPSFLHSFGKRWWINRWMEIRG
ncbi:hypothetical protein ACB092_04G038000 [Castanea dentata]